MEFEFLLLSGREDLNELLLFLSEGAIQEFNEYTKQKVDRDYV